VRGVRHTARGIEVLDVPDPEGDPDGNEVLVEVAAAGICGSDLHLLGFGPLPVTLGHEIGGWLEDGTPVAMEPNRRCGECDRCVRGDTQLCRNGLLGGVAIDGGMADYVLVTEEQVVPLPDGVAVGDASLVEPVACSVHALRRVGIEPGMRVAVVGAAALGLGAVAAAVDAGCEVGVAARHPHQLAAAESLGAVPIEGRYDVVVDAAGTASAVEQAVALARPGSSIALLGTHWDGLQAPGLPLSTKELSLVSAFAYGRHARGRDSDDAAALLAAVPELAPAMITHRFPLDDAAEAFRVAADRAAGAIKVVLEP
jgi:threonine dehydrogenase-like Zn-dependent dehydrogenase